ncbi:thiamine pyrophosphate-dependent enzyme [Paraburkholderia xenovorans]|nr:thiamine pyrophosphate-dependent enzyme [Paraburkholderia xenovorans]
MNLPVPVSSASHAMLSVFAANGIDRVFLVPGESYLGILDALGDFPSIDVVTCRHESGAGFMACADARLTRRPGVVMVSRGPGAANAAIAIHTAEQDAIPLILVVGQVPKQRLRKGAFQEIDYGRMYGSVAKHVIEVTEPEALAAAAFDAIRIAGAGTPGPVVLVVPEDIQQQAVEASAWRATPAVPTLPEPVRVLELAGRLERAQRPLVIAGGVLDVPGGREALRRLAEHFAVPVAVSFRRHDLFPNDHALYAGDLGLANPEEQMRLFESSDLVIALGSRVGDITTQGYRFPSHPVPAQSFVHCHPDSAVVNRHLAAEMGFVCDPASLAAALVASNPSPSVGGRRAQWCERLRDFATGYARWPEPAADGAARAVDVARILAKQMPGDAAICLDAGAFAAPVYRHFPFCFPRRLMAPLSGAMGYGVPSAIATQLRYPGQKTVCLVGDGGFLMTGNEIIAAVERRLPILFILVNNQCYGSIRIHQNRHYPGRHVGTSLSNPDFVRIAEAYGLQARRVTRECELDEAIAQAFAADEPCLIEVVTEPPGGPLPS